MSAAITMAVLLGMGMVGLIWWGRLSRQDGVNAEKLKQAEATIDQITRARAARDVADSLPIDEDIDNISR